MRISPISENRNNPNFQELKVSKKTLKALNCSKEDILRNDFISTWADYFDISIHKEDTNFIFGIGLDLKRSIFSSKPKFDIPYITGMKFKTREELDKVIEKCENSVYNIHIFSRNWRNSPTNDYQDICRIADIPDKPQYEKLKKYCISVIENATIWTPIADTPLIRTTIRNNNIELLKFLKSKGENLNAALDMMQKGEVSNEAREVLKDVKYQDEKIFRLESLAGSEYLRNRFFTENPNIDINSRNKNGDTLVTKAFKEKNLRLLKFLLTVDEVNWNAYDKNGRNAAGIILENNDVFNDYEGLMNFLMQIPPEKYDINAPSIFQHFGRLNGLTPFEEVLCFKQSWLKTILANPNVNVMSIRQRGKNDPPKPLAFHAIVENIDPDRILDIVNHPSFDFNITYNNQNILSYSHNTEYYPLVKNAAPKYFIKDLQKLYEKDGDLTLDAIETTIKALNSVNALNPHWLNQDINIVNDTLGHLLADIHVDIEDFNTMSRVSNILSLLKHGRYNFKNRNLIDQTPLDKAIAAENTGLIRLLKEIGG